MDQKQIGDDGVFVTEIQHCTNQCDQVQRPDAREPVPDKVSIHSETEATTDIAIPIRQNESAQDEEKIDSKVAFVTEAKAEKHNSRIAALR